MFWTILALLLMVVLGGFISYYGDLQGRRWGKKRVSWFGLRYAGLPATVPQLRWQPVLAIFLVLAAATHGLHLGIEEIITHFAGLLRSGIQCV